MRRLIKKILKEQEDDLQWAEDVVNNPHSYYGLPKVNDYVLFYFWPYITVDEIYKYIVPKLSQDNIMFDLNRFGNDKIFDHLELHINDETNQINAAIGNVGYFGCPDLKCFIKELENNGESIAIDGRKYFQIP